MKYNNNEIFWIIVIIIIFFALIDFWLFGIGMLAMTDYKNEIMAAIQNLQ